MISAIPGRASYPAGVRVSWIAGALCWVFVGAGAVFAQDVDPSSPEGVVIAAEARRYKAMIEADVGGLERILADELRYVHASGNVETKYQLIASLESGNLDYQAIEPSDVVVRIHGDTAVVTGFADFRLEVRGTRSSARLLYTAVYKRIQGGAWRLWVYQSTRHPEQP